MPGLGERSLWLLLLDREDSLTERTGSRALRSRLGPAEKSWPKPKETAVEGADGTAPAGRTPSTTWSGWWGPGAVGLKREGVGVVEVGEGPGDGGDGR
jgi:hypothetical protein